MFKKQMGQNILFSLLVTALGLYASAFYAIVDRMALAHGQAASMVGYYIAIYAAGSCVNALVGGSLADRIGKRRVIGAGLALIVVGSLIVSFTGTQAITFLGLFLIGLGFGPSEATTSALLTDENPQDASRWVNFSQIGFCLGAIIAPVVAVAYVSGEGARYQTIFMVTAAVFLLVFLAVMGSGRGRMGATAPGKPDWNIFTVLGHSRIVLYCAMVFFYLCYESVASGYFKVYFMEMGQSEAFSALMISLFWASMILCRFIGTFLSGKELPSIVIFSVIAALGALTLLLAPNNAVRVIGVLLYGGGCGPVWPMLFVLAAKVEPRRSGAICGIMMLFSTAGNSFGPAVLGSVIGNLRVTFTICTVLAVLVALGGVYALKHSAGQSARIDGGC